MNPIGPIEYIPHDYFHPIDLADMFPRHAPLEVDLGCGDGSFLVAIAQSHPERNFIGTERLFGRIRTTDRKAEHAGLSNIRLLRVESAYAVAHLLPPASVSRVYILFPDPWPKRRHWPRRLIQPQFLDAASLSLTPGGQLCIKTDDADYFAHIKKAAANHPRLISAAWTEDLPQTDFERHYAAQGRAIHSLRLTNR
ncbi:MAG: tRNA (guanosine(46)-N7)-methyltransferase TrmB [Chthoniobacteraceae bacterium]|jgi:tRNA (guanine-N7-)-methyltransferase